MHSRFARETIWAALASLLNAAARLLIVALIGRRFGAATLGVFVFAQWIIDVTFLSLSFGLPAAATRFLPALGGNASSRFKFLRTYRRYAVGVVLAVAGVAVAASWVSDIARLTSELLAVGSWALGTAIWAHSSALAQGTFQFRRLVLANGAFLAVVAIGLSGIVDAGALSSIGFLMAAANVSASSIVLRGWSVGPTSSAHAGTANAPPPLTPAVWRYALNAWIGSLAGFIVWSRGEVFVVKAIVGDVALGHYAAALTIVGTVNYGVGLVWGALAPRISLHWDQGDYKAIGALTERMTMVLMMVASTVAVVTIGLAPVILGLIFGTGFSNDAGLVALLAIGCLGLSAGAVNQVVQTATDGRFGRNTSVIGGFALLSIAWILTETMSTTGAAVARSSVQVAVAVAAFLGYATLPDARSRAHADTIRLVALVGVVGAEAIIVSSFSQGAWLQRLIAITVTTGACICIAAWRRWYAVRDIAASIMSRLAVNLKPHD